MEQKTVVNHKTQNRNTCLAVALRRQKFVANYDRGVSRKTSQGYAIPPALTKKTIESI